MSTIAARDRGLHVIPGPSPCLSLRTNHFRAYYLTEIAKTMTFDRCCERKYFDSGDRLYIMVPVLIYTTSKLDRFSRKVTLQRTFVGTDPRL